MGTGIIVCGCNGSGKSTLGKELAKKLNYQFIDIEDVYFPPGNNDYVYDSGRSREEVEKILIDEVKKYDNFVLAAVKGNYGKELTELYKYAVFIKVPKEIRLNRITNRSFQKFGNRMLPGGDLYERENQFFDMASSRTQQDVEEWLESINRPIICVDGEKDIFENVKFIIEELSRK